MLGLVTIVLEFIVGVVLAKLTTSALIPVLCVAVFWLFVISIGILRVSVEGRFTNKLSNGVFLMTLVLVPVYLGAYFVL